jgi:hypothetical protein
MPARVQLHGSPWLPRAHLGQFSGVNLSLSFGMDSVHNALCLKIRALDEEWITHFRARIPAGAVRIEIEPRPATQSGRKTSVSFGSGRGVAFHGRRTSDRCFGKVPGRPILRSWIDVWRSH